MMGSVTYKVELPSSMPRAHNVFHISKLKKYCRPENESGPLCIIVDADGTVEQEVKAILGKKRIKRTVHYLVQFEDEPESEATWMCQSDSQHCKELIQRI